MKCYGNVKGRKYSDLQPELKATIGKKLCPNCRKMRPKKDFIGLDRFPKRICKQCRLGE